MMEAYLVFKLGGIHLLRKQNFRDFGPPPYLHFHATYQYFCPQLLLATSVTPTPPVQT